MTNGLQITQPHVSAIVYGAPGLGKTTLLGTLPGKTLVIDIDNGTSVLAGRGNVDIYRPSSANVMDEIGMVYAELASQCDYDTVCIDSISELVRGSLAYLAKMGKNDGIPELSHYSKMQFGVMDVCRQFLSLDANIVFTAWDEFVEIVAPSGEKYNLSRPLINKKIVDNFCGLCDIVGRLFIHPEENNGRFVQLITSASPAVIARDRLWRRQMCRYEDLLRGDNNNVGL